MDIPRTYLADVAVAALAKTGVTELYQHMVDEAIVDLQGVMNMVARGNTDSLTSKFELAAAEALAEMPLNQWLAKWKKNAAEEHAAAKVASDAAEVAAEVVRAEMAARAEAEAAEAAAAEAAAKAKTAPPAEPPPVTTSAKPTTKAKAKNK